MNRHGLRRHPAGPARRCGWTTQGPDDLWQHTTVEEIAETAVTVVGPDEPDEDLTADDMAQAHWEYLAEHLRTQGVAARAAELSRLQHDVEPSQRLRARLGRP